MPLLQCAARRPAMLCSDGNGTASFVGSATAAQTADALLTETKPKNSGQKLLAGLEIEQ